MFELYFFKDIYISKLVKGPISKLNFLEKHVLKCNVLIECCLKCMFCSGGLYSRTLNIKRRSLSKIEYSIKKSHEIECFDLEYNVAI